MTLSSASAQIWGSPPFSKARVWLLQLKGSRATVPPFRADTSSLPRLVDGESRELQLHPTHNGSGRNRGRDALELRSSWKDSACKNLAAFPA